MISGECGADTFYYLYDGGNSVREISDTNGNISDEYIFDAFGNKIEQTGDSDNAYGFQGEQQDETGLYYLRARYMDPATGTFTSMDTYGGSVSDPMSLHKYLFANSNPAKYSDPSGHFSLLETEATMTMSMILSGLCSSLAYELVCLDADQPIDGHKVITSFLKGFLLAWCAIALVSLGGAILLLITGTVMSSISIVNGAWNIGEGNWRSGWFGMLRGLLGLVGMICLADAMDSFIEAGNDIWDYGRTKYDDDSDSSEINRRNSNGKKGGENRGDSNNRRGTFLRRRKYSNDVGGSSRSPMNQPESPIYQPTRNHGEYINGRYYSGHAIDRMQDRGIIPSVVENTIANGTFSEVGTDEFHYYDPENNITVVTNENGGVITLSYGKL